MLTCNLESFSRGRFLWAPSGTATTTTSGFEKKALSSKIDRLYYMSIVVPVATANIMATLAVTNPYTLY
jgi:hypothetical protein